MRWRQRVEVPQAGLRKRTESPLLGKVHARRFLLGVGKAVDRCILLLHDISIYQVQQAFPRFDWGSLLHSPVFQAAAYITVHLNIHEQAPSLQLVMIIARPAAYHPG
jgi:hypothetical protein